MQCHIREDFEDSGVRGFYVLRVSLNGRWGVVVTFDAGRWYRPLDLDLRLGSFNRFWPLEDC